MPTATATRKPRSPRTFTWSAQQTAIFDWFAKCARNVTRHLTVLARAGTGKTTVIIESLSHLPSNLNVLLAAFGKSIQQELESKIALANPSARVDCKTFHALGFQLIRQQWNGRLVTGYGKTVNSYRAWNLVDQVTGYDPDIPKSVKSVVARLNRKGRELTANPTVADLIELALRFNITPNYDDECDGYDLNRCAQLAKSCMDLAAKGPSPSRRGNTRGSIDFADMIFLPVRNGWVRPIYDAVIVDEYQDMSPLQLTMAQQLAKYTLVVVGDDRQGIYGFRGADTEFANTIRSTMNADELTLTRTYRCPKSVVAQAATIVPDFEAAPTNPEGEVIELPTTHDFADIKVGDAILSRLNAPLVPTCLRLLRNGTPACIKGGRDEVKGFKQLVDDLATGSAKNSIPKFLTKLANHSEREIDRILASKPRDPNPLIEAVNDRAETIRAIAEGADSIAHLKDRIERIFTQIQSGDCVTLSSVHRAKGLEWRNVYVLSDTLRHHSGDTEEENIAYVAWTRAMHSLRLVGGMIEQTAIERPDVPMELPRPLPDHITADINSPDYDLEIANKLGANIY